MRVLNDTIYILFVYNVFQQNIAGRFTYNV